MTLTMRKWEYYMTFVGKVNDYDAKEGKMNWCQSQLDYYRRQIANMDSEFDAASCMLLAMQINDAEVRIEALAKLMERIRRDLPLMLPPPDNNEW